LHGTDGSFLKHGLDPQEDALKKGELPEGRDWGKEPAAEWGRLNTEIGPHDGPYQTLPGNYGAYYEDIYQALTAKRDPAVTARQANLVVRVIEAAFESSRLGRRVKL
jgi:predicted dehydrogenase